MTLIYTWHHSRTASADNLILGEIMSEQLDTCIISYHIQGNLTGPTPPRMACRLKRYYRTGVGWKKRAALGADEGTYICRRRRTFYFVFGEDICRRRGLCRRTSARTFVVGENTRLRRGHLSSARTFVIGRRREHLSSARTFVVGEDFYRRRGHASTATVRPSRQTFRRLII